MSVIYGKSSFYNPFFLNDKGKEREIEEIQIYNEKGEIVFKLRWFSGSKYTNNRNGLTAVELKQEIIRRIKPKFDGKTFFVSYKGRYSFDKGKAILYIPIKDLEIKEIERQTKNFETYTEDLVVYQVNEKEIYFSNYEKPRKTKENIKNERIEKLIKNSRFSDFSWKIKNHLKELKKLIEDIEKIKSE